SLDPLAVSAVVGSVGHAPRAQLKTRPAARRRSNSMARAAKPKPTKTLEQTLWCPASSCWQVLGLGKVGGQRVGQAQVHLQGPVPGDRLVRSHGVVLGPVVVGVRDEGQDVVDLFEEEPLV